MMTLITYIILMVMALLDLVAMLRWDFAQLRLSEWDNAAYLAKLKADDGIVAVKRLIVLVVLVGLLTTMALMSWMVVMIFAAALLAQAVVLLRQSSGTPLLSDERTKGMFCFAMGVALIIVTVAIYVVVAKGMTSIFRSAALALILMTLISPALVMLSNKVIKREKAE